MKRMIALITALIIGFGIAFAKSDYKNPVESQIVAELLIQPTKSPYYNVVKRNIYLTTDKYDNHYLSINVNYFVKKNKDALEVSVGDNSFTLSFTSGFKQLAYSFYPENPTFAVTTIASTVGNYTTAKTTIYKQKYNYYEFYSVYLLTNEQYELIKENGIDKIAVEGIYQIIIQ